MRILFSAVFLCCVALSGAETFSFARPVRTGELFECRIRLSRSARYAFTLPGRNEPVVKLDTAEADFHGFLLVREVNAAGNPVRLLIRRCLFSGSLDGRAVEAITGASPEIEADLSGKESAFSCAGRALSSGQLALLRQLFPPVSSLTLGDLAGRSRVLPKAGEGWKPDLKPFLDQLKQRRIELPSSAFSGWITYLGKEKTGGLDCRKFTLRIETAGLTDYDCRYRFSFLLAPSGPPVRMTLDAVEVIRQVLRSGEPMSAGTILELIQQDQLEQSLTPVSEVPPPETGKKQPGTWDFLLR